MAEVAGKLDVVALRQEFPILRQRVHGRPLVYLDNAATSQKPQSVIDAITGYYTQDNANIHRGVHLLSQRSTKRYEDAREKVRRLLGAAKHTEIVFVRGTTEAINLVAASWGTANVRAGDEILITGLEHHSNIVPWQLLCERTGAKLRVAPIDDRGDVILEEYERLLSERTKLVSMVHVSNALGTVNPVAAMTAMAKRVGAVVLVDGAQATPHLRVNVREIGCDFYAISSHKMFGPTGSGALYGRQALLEAMPPWQGGGDMITSVTFEKSTWNVVPHKFEAGTPDIADGIGFGASVDFLDRVGVEAIAAHEHEILDYATERIRAIPGARIIGEAKEKASVLSFVLDGIHPHDIGTIVDQEGVAIRTGHHCAQPVMDRFCIPATARASFALYNTKEDVDALVAAVGKVVELFG